MFAILKKSFKLNEVGTFNFTSRVLFSGSMQADESQGAGAPMFHGPQRRVSWPVVVAVHHDLSQAEAASLLEAQVGVGGKRI